MDLALYRPNCGHYAPDKATCQVHKPLLMDPYALDIVAQTTVVSPGGGKGVTGK
jgi:hypothetical protein